MTRSGVPISDALGVSNQAISHPRLRDQLERWARLPNLKRVVIAHGDIIANDAARALDRVAKDLAA